MLRGTPSNRGQVLIIFVFAIVGLIGITGLAIDGGNIYADRRHAQNAADTAALAAALTKVKWDKLNGACDNFNTTTLPLPSCSDSIVQAAWQIASDNGYDGVMNNHVNVYNPPKDGIYSNCSQLNFSCYDYVEVIINDDVDTFFARVLGIGQLHNTVEAVALAKYRAAGPLYGGDALVILAPHAVSGKSGEFVTKGSATANVYGGDIFVNSDNQTSAFTETSGCIVFNMDPGHSIKVVGNWKTTSCSTPPPTTHTTPTQFPPDEPIPTEPKECSQTPKTATIDPDGYTHMYPGYYSTSGSSQFPYANNTRLDPGVYCIDGLIKTTNPNTYLEGTGVLLYIRAGGSFDFGGGTTNISAPAAGSPYAGYLIYAAPNYQLSPPNCNITAGAADTFTGVIYAPYCNTTINGGSASVGLSAKLVVYTLLINGSNTLNFYYNDNSNPGVPEIDMTGLFH